MEAIEIVAKLMQTLFMWGGIVLAPGLILWGVFVDEDEDDEYYIWHKIGKVFTIIGGAILLSALVCVSVWWWIR